MKPRWATASRFERVLGARYPFGISRRSSPVLSHSAKRGTHSPILFVADLNDGASDDAFAGPQGELLLKAFVQGLSWPREQVELLFVHNSQADLKKAQDRKHRHAVSQQLSQTIETKQPRAVVALGKDAASLLGMPEQPLSVALESRLVERNGIYYLGTADLKEVVSAPDVKRIFWNDLKGFSAKIKMQ